MIPLMTFNNSSASNLSLELPQKKKKRKIPEADAQI
jgi:hypothetical protein